MSLVEKTEETLKMPIEDALLIGGTLLASAGFGIYDGLVEKGGLESGQGRQWALGIVSFYGLAGIVAGTGLAIESNTKIKDIKYPGITTFYPMNKKKTLKDLLKYVPSVGAVCAGIPAAFYLAGRGLGCLARQVC
jgi:hypothetical protein